jgi:nitrous oxidase accessory protein
MNKLKALFLIALIIAGLLTAFSLPAKANSKTITVPTDFPTIQAAINGAAEGDTVYVKTGTYGENMVIDKALSLVGENEFSTVVSGSGNTACLIQHNNVNVTGFTFRSTSTMRWYYGIHLLNVKYCNIFKNNIESTFYGIWLYESSFNSIFENTASGDWNGIHLTTSDNNNISNNTITNSHDWGISTEGSNYNLILGNYVASNGGAGISLDVGSPNTNNLIAQNTITRNGYNGIEITSVDSINNKIVGNSLTANGNTFGIAILLAWDNNLVMNNYIMGNQVGIRLDATKNNTIFQNLIENNPQGAILIHSPPYRIASQNIIYKNNIFNTVNLTGNIQANSWDNSTIGNYWNNYNGTDTNGDGIGDNPYVIDRSNVDHYPLVSKINISAEIPSSFLSEFTTPAPTASPTLTSTPSPTSTVMTASLSESASALNYRNTVNFTVFANGGTKPYTFAWYIDGQIAQTSASQYFSTNSQTVGSHHVYVQVTDADNNSATTLTIEFNVLPISSNSPDLSPSLSSSPTQQPPSSPTSTSPDYYGGGVNAIPQILGIIALAVSVTAVVVVLLIKRRRFT